ncbi:MAG: hypothetical protein M0P69_09090 [Bacteroidales bacterium]|nr:hypothetical protein [Bacteroidales bacterium]MDD2569659.1 hypothetical protein [Bacteroidales bacterium]MDD2812087.1 hypothetical protein [Bacteroidales bacterium]MDD3384770.1 hypothetical protein [Bacteroidales bacterium]MDD3810871.1 hypothetical protein [Bacteroidales bacterium]
MKAITLYIRGYDRASKSFRMLFLIYAAYLVAALLLAIPFLSLAKGMGANSMLPAELMNGFDATVIRELMASGGPAFAVYIKGFLPWMIAFLLLQVYLTGGMVAWVSNPWGRFQFQTFVRESNRLFIRYLKLISWIVIWQIITAMVIWLAWSILVGTQELISDQTLVITVIVAGIIHLMSLLFILMAADLARSSLFLQDSQKSLKTLWQSVKLQFRRFSSIYLLSLLLFLVPCALILLFYWFRSGVIVNNGWILLGVVMIQQLFILARIFLRIWRLASACACQIHCPAKDALQ